MGDGKPRFCIHPKEAIVGVCALCLDERLVVLASKQHRKGSRRINYEETKRKPFVKLSSLFTLSSLLLNWLDFGHQKPQPSNHNSSASEEDSFISIKFEKNGVASWDKDPKLSLDHHHNLSKVKKIKTVVKHSKPRPALRWRRRIGQLLQLIRWKKSGKRSLGTKLEGAKIRHGWLRSLTRKRTKE